MRLFVCSPAIVYRNRSCVEGWWHIHHLSVPSLTRTRTHIFSLAQLTAPYFGQGRTMSVHDPQTESSLLSTFFPFPLVPSLSSLCPDVAANFDTLTLKFLAPSCLPVVDISHSDLQPFAGWVFFFH